ncbi:MAG: Ribosylnicotinamide kinase [Cytophagales bacterium]|jgi:NadR type nicotinamide-nucleotide adenylyltransferase|nr:ATP-binding protein [Bacteroidota bacterium]MBS1982278.1 ATP-binding protein [Bacteroidota bacterium]WHZ07626.1 MAG: Ribosylnicotinamide kinase [Cytophagales bacterium]
MQVTQENVRDIKKVCVIGPECTGKTDLSKYLAEFYQTPWVEEYARAYLNKLGRSYDQVDLLKIAHGQLRMEDEWVYEANRLLICDTNLIVIKIWSEHKYGNCDPDILKKINERAYDHYLLTNIDVPWENDIQREHPDKREYFWQRFKEEIIKTGVPYTEISGSRDERRKKAIDAINKILL